MGSAVKDRNRFWDLFVDPMRRENSAAWWLFTIRGWAGDLCPQGLNCGPLFGHRATRARINIITKS
jgi:hypothetical protein